MKGYGIEDLTTVVREIKNSEEKKNLYILLGIFIAVAAGRNDARACFRFADSFCQSNWLWRVVCGASA
jgi:hypothetical protein